MAKMIGISRSEALVRRLANAVFSQAMRDNDMHGAEMVKQAMDDDDTDQVDIGGFLQGYAIVEDPRLVGQEVEVADDEEEGEDIVTAEDRPPGPTRRTPVPRGGAQPAGAAPSTPPWPAGSSERPKGE